MVSVLRYHYCSTCWCSPSTIQRRAATTKWVYLLTNKNVSAFIFAAKAERNVRINLTALSTAACFRDESTLQERLIWFDVSETATHRAGDYGMDAAWAQTSCIMNQNIAQQKKAKKKRRNNRQTTLAPSSANRIADASAKPCMLCLT